MRTRPKAVVWLLCGALLGAGCGVDVVSDAPDGGGATAGLGGAPNEWMTAIEGNWTLPARSEEYVCVYQTLTETVFVSALDPISPSGTHHTFVSIGSPTRADGVASCDPSTNHPTFVGSSGVGTSPYLFPEGVALRMEAGQQLLLNLHLFNNSNKELSGTSGVRIKTLAPGDVVHEAEAVVAGNVDFSLPPGESTVQGICTMTGEATVFGLFPHMHMLGTHFKVEASSSVQGNVVLHDDPFRFDNQKLYDVGPIELRSGDRVTASCTYDNTTGSTVSFGDSTLQEMCFLVIYSYPNLNREVFCLN